jgi:quinol monooxygenase YgiN
MSVYQMALMGGAGVGAAIWGKIASLTDLRTALLCAAGSGLVGLFFTRHLTVGGRGDEDLTPVRLWREPETATPIDPDEGPVLITIEYQVDPQRADEFAAVMRDTRRSRLRNGAISWELFRDTADPGRYIEYFVDESWVDHLRRQDRQTAADAMLRERRLEFQRDGSEPRVSRYIATPVRRD